MRISDWSSDVCSSDLSAETTAAGSRPDLHVHFPRSRRRTISLRPDCGDVSRPDRRAGAGRRAVFRSAASLYMVADGRSEEHTSELQSLMRISYAVFCLKKKTNQRYNQH